jgi:hypothetical protein
VLLLVLVVSYRQVIAVHPNGGGAYAVAKKDLGRTVRLCLSGDGASPAGRDVGGALP